MKTYIIIEQKDIEITRMDCYSTVWAAEDVLKACCALNKANEVDLDQLEPVLRGTLGIAGNDSGYCVQLIERDV